jgi:hypothetical protein
VVVRAAGSAGTVYHFFQVKTKDKLNHLWKRIEVLGLPASGKPNPKRIANSHAGKLLLHTVRFKQTCGNVVFLTNIQLSDELNSFATALADKNYADPHVKKLVKHFDAAFNLAPPSTASDIHERLVRLKFEAGQRFLDPHDQTFKALAREEIFRYSEVDLEYNDAERIIRDLLALVERKSLKKVVAQATAEDLDDIAGIGIADLLGILSISKDAYDELRMGGDSKAVRNASILHRKLEKAGASLGMIQYGCKCKVQWDNWFREKRHSIPAFELNFLMERLNALRNELSGGALPVAALERRIPEVEASLSPLIAKTISKEILLGGVFSALVRGAS